MGLLREQRIIRPQYRLDCWSLHVPYCMSDNFSHSVAQLHCHMPKSSILFLCFCSQNSSLFFFFLQFQVLYQSSNSSLILRLNLTHRNAQFQWDQPQRVTVVFCLLAAISNSRGEFLLNGEFVVSMFKREIKVGNAVIEYSGSDHVIERINCTERIEEEITVQVNCHESLVCHAENAKLHLFRCCSMSKTLERFCIIKHTTLHAFSAGAVCGEPVQPRCQVLL